MKDLTLEKTKIHLNIILNGSLFWLSKQKKEQSSTKCKQVNDVYETCYPTFCEPEATYKWTLVRTNRMQYTKAKRE
jgi:hypothetical protein